MPTSHQRQNDFKWYKLKASIICENLYVSDTYFEKRGAEAVPDGTTELIQKCLFK